MKIALAGAHSQGKTTILNELKKNPKYAHFKFIDSPTRQLMAEGNFINESGNANTQLLIMMQHFKNTCCNDAVFDRCAIDGLAYSLYFWDDIIKNKLANTFIELFNHTLKQYDVIFYIKPELALIDDGTRSQDINFFNAIVNNFNNVLTEYNVNYIELQGSVEERVDLIHNAVNI
jgi:nicotinamide riboside kinase